MFDTTKVTSKRVILYLFAANVITAIIVFA